MVRAWENADGIDDEDYEERRSQSWGTYEECGYRWVPVLVIEKKYLDVVKPTTMRNGLRWAPVVRETPLRILGPNDQPIVDLPVQSVTIKARRLSHSERVRPRVCFEGEDGDRLLWFGYSPSELLPVKIQEACRMPQPLRDHYGDNIDTHACGHEYTRCSIAMWVWMMRVFTPGVLCVIRCVHYTAWRKQVTVDRVTALVERGVECVNAAVQGELRAWESGATPRWRTHWHSQVYQEFMHPLGEPWIAHAEDPVLDHVSWSHQRPTIVQRVWGRGRVLAFLDKCTRFTSDTRVGWLRFMWTYKLGPWGVDDEDSKDEDGVDEIFDPYSELIWWHADAPDEETTLRVLRMVKREGFYWPWGENDLVEEVRGHSALALLALVAITALVTLERFAYTIDPGLAFAARAARAAWIPMFTQERPYGCMPLYWLSDAWLTEPVLADDLMRIHAYWPDPNGVLTWEDLPHRTDVLYELGLWSLQREPSNTFVGLMIKATPYRSNSRRMGDKTLKAYNDPALDPVVDKPIPATEALRKKAKKAKDKKDKKDKKAKKKTWAQKAYEAAVFRGMFNQMSWCTMQGLYETAVPPDGTWGPSLATHAAWTCAGPRGVGPMIGSSDRHDAEWHMVVLIVMREYLCHLIRCNAWFVNVVRGRFDTHYFHKRTVEMANALRGGIRAVPFECDRGDDWTTWSNVMDPWSHDRAKLAMTFDLDNVITEIQPYKTNTKKKQVYRNRGKSSPTIVYKQARSVVSIAMILYATIRTDMLPRLREARGLLVGHVKRMRNCLAHMHNEVGPDLDYVRTWTGRHEHLLSTSRPPRRQKKPDETDREAERLASLAAQEARLPKPIYIDEASAEDRTRLMAALDAMCVRLIWPLSGQCTANIWNYVSRCPPIKRFFVAPLTLSVLGGISDKTAATVQSILLSDPVTYGPKRIDACFADLPLRDARILVWWIRGVNMMNAIRLVPQPKCIAMSAEWAKKTRLVASYGQRVADEIIANGGDPICDADGNAPPPVDPATGRPDPNLPRYMWTVMTTRCCGTIVCPHTVDRIGYHTDLGCMVCHDGIHKRHSASSSGNDGNTTLRIGESMNPKAHLRWFYGFWSYDAFSEYAECNKIASDKWHEHRAFPIRTGGGGANRAADLAADPVAMRVMCERIAIIRRQYVSEICSRVAFCDDIVKEEKMGGRQTGSHRTRRMLTMMMAELRALQTGDSTYRVPLAMQMCAPDREAMCTEVTTSGTMGTYVTDMSRTAVYLGFWWCTENQLLSKTGNAPTIDKGVSDLFWNEFIPDPHNFVDRLLRTVVENMEPDMEIGGMGIGTLGRGPVTPAPSDWDKYVRSARIICFKEPCVNAPVEEIYARGMRLHNGSDVTYSHCPSCATWDRENYGWGWLDGLWSCSACVIPSSVDHCCMHASCKVHHQDGSSAIFPLMGYSERAFEQPEQARQLTKLKPLFSIYRAGVDVSDNLAGAWNISWWCKPHHHGVMNWFKYWASMEEARDKLVVKRRRKNLAHAQSYHGMPHTH